MKPYSLLSLLLIILLLICACNAGEKVNSSGMEVKPSFNSIQLINRAFSKGDISYDEAMVLKAYAIFDRKKLPEEYRSDVPSKGATMLLKEIRRSYDELGEEARGKIRPYLGPKKRKVGQ